MISMPIRRTSLPLVSALAFAGIALTTLYIRKRNRERKSENIPTDTAFDNTLALLQEPYHFISRRCEKLQSDVFQTRVMFQDMICMRGSAAAALFYDETKFVRLKAAPLKLKSTLFGFGAVQGMDGEAHRHRKQMLMSMMTPQKIGSLRALAAEQWVLAAEKWKSQEQVVLYDALHQILGRAVYDWCGVPVEETEMRMRLHDLRAMFDYAGAVNLRHFEASFARRRTEKWLSGLIQQIRDGKLKVDEESPVFIIAHYRDLSGSPLSPHQAAVELINLLRPTVAVSVYIVFVAHALHQNPRCLEALKADEGYTELFVQEVRRLYPFFPAVIAKVREDFEWQGYVFKQGKKVMLDLYGTNHDGRTWQNPDAFDPKRFLDWDGSPYNFIPQGGGDHYRDHRCAGEALTIDLMKDAVRLLTEKIRYQVPEQDLRLDYSRLPALPKSRFIINQVHLV